METISISNTTGSINFYNLRTGAVTSRTSKLKNLKSSCLVVSSNDDLILSPQSDRPLIYTWGSKQSLRDKIITPEIIACLELSRSESLLFGGGVSGRVYVWDFTTGRLITILDAHYKAVSGLKSSIDDKYLVTSSQDGLIKVYSIQEITKSKNLNSNQPLTTLSFHSLPITSLSLGWTFSMTIITSSLDRTVKISSMAPNQKELSILFPRALTFAILDTPEVNIYAGSITGDIYTTSLYAPPTPEIRTFQGHTAAITGLLLSMDESLLVSTGGEECRVWDSLTGACLRMVGGKMGEITSLRLGFWDDRGGKSFPSIFLSRFVEDQSKGEKTKFLKKEIVDGGVKFGVENALAVLRPDERVGHLRVGQSGMGMVKSNEDLFKAMV